MSAAHPPLAATESSHHPHDQLVSEWPTAATDFDKRYSPCKIEADVQGLEVLGALPREIDGTFYRVFPDPNQPQTYNTKVSQETSRARSTKVMNLRRRPSPGLIERRSFAQNNNHVFFCYIVPFHWIMLTLSYAFRLF